MKACWLLLVTGTLATPAAAAPSPVPPDPANSVIAWAPGLEAERARLDRACRGRRAPCGLPVLVKDNIDIAGMVTTAGSRALLANLRSADAPLVARLRRAGLLILGKTNLSEWANFRASASISGWSGVGGQTRNPHVLDRNPCGSSSGSGAAVAAGVAPAAIGTETNGSITCPAAVNGIVGLKPTVGLVSRTGIVPISHSQDTAGPMAIDVETTARLLTVIAGSDPADPATREADRRRTDYAAGLAGASLKGVRLGVLRFATGWSPPVDSAFEAALETLRREGAILVDIADVPDRRAIGEAELQVLLSEFKAGVNTYLSTTPPAVRSRTLADVIAFNRADSARTLGLFGQDLLERAEATAGLDDPAYLAARATSLKLAAGWLEAAFKTHRVEALLAPTAPPAWKIDAVNGDQAPFGGAPGLAAVAGTPHLTVPLARHLGLPLGLSFLGPAWSEARLLQLGAAWERARGPLPPPAFRPSLETAPEVAPLFQPMPR
ncbi:MAG: amidase [Sphingomonadaceae bacterium]